MPAVGRFTRPQVSRTPFHPLPASGSQTTAVEWFKCHIFIGALGR
jgi:hypothetical protein